MSVKKLRAVGEVLHAVQTHCAELHEANGDEGSAAAHDWVEQLAWLTNFGGRARNASLRDEVLILAANALRHK